MAALRYVYLAALLVWLGGLVTLGTLVAPTVFQVLQERDPASGRVLAGAVFGGILRRFHLVSYAAGVVMLVSLGAATVLGPRPAAAGIRMTVVAAMLALSLYSGLPLTREIEHLQQEIGVSVQSLPAEDPRRERFERLHTLSTAIMMVNIAGGLVLLSWEARR